MKKEIDLLYYENLNKMNKMRYGDEDEDPTFIDYMQNQATRE